VVIITKKKRSIKKLAKYRIRFDHVIDGKTIFDKDTKDDAMRLIRKKLGRVPYAKANLKVLNKEKDGYKHKSSWMFRRRQATGRMRLVKL